MPERDLDAIYELCSRMVYWTAYSIVRSDADAMDISQTAFLRAIKHKKKLDTMNDLQIKAWMYRVARNLAMDIKRREKRITPVEEFFDSEVSDEASMPESSAVSGDIRRLVREAVYSLPEIYREVVLMHYFSGMNYMDIASVMGVSEGTIKSRMFRAKEKLALLLKDEGDLL